MKTITALFANRTEAQVALEGLERAGFTHSNINVIVTEDTRGKHFALDKHTKAAEGATAGATIGGVTGALFLALASAGTLAIPGLNLIVSGALVGALAGLGAGAAAGGLVGSLVGMGVPEVEAKLYEESVKKGAILIAIEASNDEREKTAKDVLKNANAQKISALAA